MGVGRAPAPSISCKELTRPGSRGGDVKDSGRVSSDTVALDFPLVVGDGVATEMRSGG